MNDPIPNEAPPAYTPTDHLQVPSAAAASSAGAESADRRHRRTSSAGSTASSNYTTDDDHYEESGNGIPEDVRRDMLDESRPLPDGWRREFDANSGHYFYVDTKANPPRSIWSHPLDDVSPEYLRAHPEVAEKLAPAAPPSDKASESKESHHHSRLHKTPSSSHASTSASASTSTQQEDNRTLGRKMKDKLTGTTHEQRVEQRRKQAEQEKKEYEAYLRRRAQIRQAQAEGRYRPMYGAPMGPYVRTVPMGYGGYGGGMYGGGMYGRPYYGSGIGMGTRSGMGTGMALGGGLLGGLLLGDLMF
ncbi:hypothetical protein C6P46_002241 [Rhodotorula mucilaginosa]|uniref:WW domain-containing protein n=1 Tax=Rhodotorula mucilaginosa TaxID=5537 RepID=A0A9P6W4R0_RHOMI|nr:hypothetical protein C6P46_002241 [Rhodotorula mucilaginosa]TKA53652.1 hypothetical protein B0A53_03694 [Rhodotorula sp. CCFEE 5036]